MQVSSFGVRRVALGVLMGALIAGVAGCSSNSANGSNSSSVEGSDILPVPSSWKLANAPLLPRSELNFAAEGRATGFGGCNSYFAAFETKDEGLRFGAIGATRKFCLPDTIANAESKYLATLDKTKSWRINGNSLILRDASGNEILRFNRK